MHENVNMEKYSILSLFLPRDAGSAKLGIAIVSRLSVRLSVRPSVGNVEVQYSEHIGWTSSKVVTRISLGCLLLGFTTSAI